LTLSLREWIFFNVGDWKTNMSMDRFIRRALEHAATTETTSNYFHFVHTMLW